MTRTYRFYRVGSDGHIIEPPTVGDFESDRRAIQAAETLLDGNAIEVWELARIVIRLAPKSAAPDTDSIVRPLCPKCGAPTLLSRIEPDLHQHERITFECPECRHEITEFVKFK